MQQLTELFRKTYHAEPLCTKQIAKAGSNRVYVRLWLDECKTVVGVIGQSKAENDCFVYLSRHFEEKHLPVPHVIAVSEDGMRYLQTDLGSIALYDALKPSRENDYRYTEQDAALLEKTIRLLPHFQVLGNAGLDYTHCLHPEPFDKMTVFFDLNYFKYCFLKPLDHHFDERRLERDFERLAADIMEHSQIGFLYRDFQARNVMLADGKEPCFIDFQGGFQGPLQYDLVSFLWQASSKFPDKLRKHLIDCYLDELRKLQDVDTEKFLLQLDYFILFRMLQVLGAYGLRGFFERKQYFLNSIPHALNNIQQLYRRNPVMAEKYAYLSEVVDEIVSLPRWEQQQAEAQNHQYSELIQQPSAQTQQPSAKTHQPSAQTHQPSVSKYENQGALTVTVMSFSYKKGIPDDPSGNGGGYVFDCRSTHNPGRYEAYKNKTGLDSEVIDFLEKDGEILDFLSHVRPLCEHHVERFIKRGFTHLMICFGCTGGQHRSVYSAQHIAEHLHHKYNIRVRLVHREQGLENVLE